MTPQVIVTLAPDGSLIAELPSANGSRRQIALKLGKPKDGEPHVEATLLRILQNQLRQKVEIGLDGAPTGHQVRHWEQHALWKDPQCSFCIKEIEDEKRKREALGLRKRAVREQQDKLLTSRDGITVRRISKRGKVVATSESCEELGL